MRVTFAELFDRMSERGVAVGLALDGAARLSITLSGPSSARSLRLPVHGDVDRTATLLVLSGQLRELTSNPAQLASGQSGPGWHVRGAWPELLELWPVGRAAGPA